MWVVCGCLPDIVFNLWTCLNIEFMRRFQQHEPNHPRGEDFGARQEHIQYIIISERSRRHGHEGRSTNRGVGAQKVRSEGLVLALNARVNPFKYEGKAFTMSL